MTTEQVVEFVLLVKRYRAASRVERQAETAASIPERLRLELKARQARRDCDLDCDLVLPPEGR
jgi:hypothetical protein